MLCYQPSGGFRRGSGGTGYIPPRQSYEGVSNTCLVTTGSHIATNLAVFFPSFSFFVAVSEGGGSSEEGGGGRGREKGAEGEKLRKGSSPLFVLFHMFFARFPFRSSSLTKIF